MANDRYLLDYLPPYMQEYLEMKAILQAEQPEIDALWSSVETAFANQYIMDATEYGVKRWETMLHISPKATETLDERKFRILTRLNQKLPYTLVRLREMLTSLCGEDGFTIDLQADQYHITIKLGVGNHNNYQAVNELLANMIPANMTQAISILYNTHDALAEFTHQYLSQFTHEHIRKEVLA